MKLFVELDSQLEILNPILKEMKECASKNLKMGSHLILGDRGVGKTTFLKWFFERVEKDSKLEDAFNLIFVPTSFHGGGIASRAKKMIYDVGINDLRKHQVLLIDDLDMTLAGPKNEAHDLREILIREEPRVSLIATARSIFSERLGYDKAFYGFLSQHRLMGGSDKDVMTLLQGVLGTKKWHKLNEELAHANPFWVMTIADSNPRLLTILNNIFHMRRAFVTPEEFLLTYFEMAGPTFKNELMELPRYSRYFLEEASSCEQFFKVKDLNLNIKNPFREASKLVQFGYLKKSLEGEYSFTHRPLKAWLRYMRQVPLGRVLNVDIEAPIVFSVKYHTNQT